jgi:hypothetical protein
MVHVACCHDAAFLRSAAHGKQHVKAGYGPVVLDLTGAMSAGSLVFRSLTLFVAVAAATAHIVSR